MRFSVLLSLTASLLPLWAQAQSAVFLVDLDGNPGRFSELEARFIESRFALLDLNSCTAAPLSAQPRLDYRRLELLHGENLVLKLHVAPDVLRSGELVLYSGSASEGWTEYSNCETDILLPVLALMVTTDLQESTAPSLMRQRVVARNSGLTSHEPSRLLARWDSDDQNSLFMDFTLSSKHPILPRSKTINSAYDNLTEALEHFIPGESEYYMQLYMAFTGRFSQYIGSRESSPVVARRFNPELFYRLWSDASDFVDLGLGHESNGQRLDTPEAFAFAGIDYEQNGEPAYFARDSLSRGWDYTLLTWQRPWNERLVTQLKLRHYLSKGPMQGSPEEYNTWEDEGYRNRPRRQYDGFSLNFQYRFPQSRCLLGDLPICFRRVALTQETGNGSPFANNTSTVELTSDFFGLPLTFWARSGYNSDLVDYYRYSNSWGLGIELISR
jgi:hypothetical protein